VKITLPYGEHTIDADVPDDAVVLAPTRVDPLADPAAAVRRALDAPLDRRPLREMVRRHQRAAIVVSDVTRPVPYQVLLPPILETLEAGGIARGDITIVVGTGLHRPSRPDEHRRFLGDAIMRDYRIVDHDARDRSMLAFHATGPRTVGVWLNRDYLNADLRIVTGFVEPHLFAGYSGGGKAVMPGVAGADDIMANHSATMLGHPKATWCTTDGNPIFEQMRDVALKTDPSFTLNVTLDERKRITSVFAGELRAAHDAAIAQAAAQALRPIPHLFDVVVVTNMGYPADLNLYQSVKGMSVAAQAVAPGGAIVLVAECREGVGGHEYVALMHSAATPHELLARFESSEHRTLHDQWQVQVQAMVQARAEVYLHSSLDRPTTEAAHLRHSADISATVAALVAAKRTETGREPTVCVMPWGQLTVPRLDTAGAMA
jgi:nickel-dependent lactate racemase